MCDSFFATLERELPYVAVRIAFDASLIEAL